MREEMYLSIIIAEEYASNVHEHINNIIKRNDNLKISSFAEETYWKDDTLQKIVFKIEVCNAMPEQDWIQLFDKHLKHHNITRDNSFLEIDHYSSLDDRNVPFVVADIPIALVK